MQRELFLDLYTNFIELHISNPQAQESSILKIDKMTHLERDKNVDKVSTSDFIPMETFQTKLRNS